MDRYEVTNREFKRFVDSGGYRRQGALGAALRRWTERGSLEAGDGLMTDRTGRPGPSTWEAGDYPRRAGQLPGRWGELVRGGCVRQVRRARPLPTVVHWNRAAGLQQRLHRPVEQLLGPGTRPVGSRRNQRLRHLRHGGQRARVVPQRRRQAASFWAAAGTTRRTSSPMPTPSRRSTGRRPTGSGW